MTENERNKTLPHKSMDRHTLTYYMRHQLIQGRDNRNALYATHLLNVFLWLHMGDLPRLSQRCEVYIKWLPFGYY